MAILIVEDEQQLAQNIKKGLELEKYAADVAYDGEEGLKKALENEYSVIILDILLPKRDGISVCRELRDAGVHTPVIMLSARAKLQDRIDGLDAGADDYITKPFGFAELLARIRSVLRRRKTATPTILTVGDVVLDPARHEVTRDGKRLELTPKEYSILEYLMQHPGEALSREQLLMHVWGADTKKTNNALNVHMRYLRRKLDDPFSKHYVRTVRGVGYKIED